MFAPVFLSTGFQFWSSLSHDGQLGVHSRTCDTLSLLWTKWNWAFYYMKYMSLYVMANTLSWATMWGQGQKKSLQLWARLSRGKTWLDCSNLLSLCVSEWNGGQSERSCRVLKWIIIRHLWSEAYKRDELKIFSEHLGGRRISKAPLIAAEQSPPLKRILPH